ncbi:hypothetical protein JG688_00011677 [Phytophthora aleatoria]|uniref:DUF659 domain-containing protein n=1 Tax=Phytophthora aleatoria TaxID=2496075 RepID=A0A8J5IC85_9STRA|nr:hypothetical protein JG688_00011677 [Phytophthora aleatoria]
MTEASLSQSQPAMSFTGEIDSAEKKRVQSEIARGFYAADEVNDAAGKPVVISVTTDNAPVMQKAWELLEQQRSISCNGCSSHALNHILEEVLRLPWMELALSKSVTLSKFIRNRLQLLDKFRELQNDGKEGHRRALRLPVPTRWYYSFECIKSVSDNQRTIDRLFRQKTFMKRFGKKPARPNEARGIVEDKEFWRRLKQVQKLLQPVVEVIAMLE